MKYNIARRLLSVPLLLAALATLIPLAASADSANLCITAIPSSMAEDGP